MSEDYPSEEPTLDDIAKELMIVVVLAHHNSWYEGNLLVLAEHYDEETNMITGLAHVKPQSPPQKIKVSVDHILTFGEDGYEQAVEQAMYDLERNELTSK